MNRVKLDAEFISKSIEKSSTTIIQGLIEDGCEFRHVQVVLGNWLNQQFGYWIVESDIGFYLVSDEELDSEPYTTYHEALQNALEKIGHQQFSYKGNFDDGDK
ncbi:MAG: hypothetical protein AAFV93_05880 [Chloroflexota bacterium]